MNHEQAQANLQIVLDRIDALRRGEVDAIAERFHPTSPGRTSPAGSAATGASRCSPRCAPRPPSRD
jgi:hypothetical protein